jgi:hypothetical protein
LALDRADSVAVAVLGLSLLERQLSWLFCGEKEFSFSLSSLFTDPDITPLSTPTSGGKAASTSRFRCCCRSLEFGELDVLPF